MNVLVAQLDGKLPNLALMRISAHHKSLGDDVTFRRFDNPNSLQRNLGDVEFDRAYASLIFERTRPNAAAFLRAYPDAIIGGTGWDFQTTLESINIPDGEIDYTIYPTFRSSIGFTQRGCRLKCPFCVVPKKEGAIRENSTITEIWRGEPWPKEILLLDNDFFGQPNWRDRIRELREGKFKVSFSQGINARLLNEETAEAIASVDYRDDGMKERRIYTAWDNQRDEQRLFAGLEALVRAGVRPRSIMVYMLIGYWPGETAQDREHRRSRLREFGALPYPMPFQRTRELVGFQRWVIGGYDRRGITWDAWVHAGYQPRKLGFSADDLFRNNRPVMSPHVIS